MKRLWDSSLNVIMWMPKNITSPPCFPQQGGEVGKRLHEEVLKRVA